MLTSIITHPGGAHKDDFLACAVLLTQAPVAIERRDPTEADLNDASVAVLDDAREFCDWLEVAEWFDCRGPVDTAKWLEVERDTLAKLNSPIDLTLLRRFAAQSAHKPGEPIWELMRMIGEDLVGYITSLRTRLDFIAEHAAIWELDGFKALYMPRTEPMPDEPSAGLGRYIEQQGLENEVLAMVYPDRRGEGYGMRRFNDDPRMDFTRLNNEDDVHFTHARGFIAKTSANDVERLKAMLGMAFHS